MGQALGTYMLPAQRAINRSWSGSEQPGQSISVNGSLPNDEETGSDGLASASGWPDRNDTTNQGLDPLHSAQGDYAIQHLCALHLWNGGMVMSAGRRCGFATVLHDAQRGYQAHR